MTVAHPDAGMNSEVSVGEWFSLPAEESTLGLGQTYVSASHGQCSAFAESDLVIFPVELRSRRASKPYILAGLAVITSSPSYLTS